MDLIWIIYLTDMLGSGDPLIGWGGLVTIGMFLFFVMLFGTMIAYLSSADSTGDCFKKVLGEVSKFKTLIICCIAFCSFGIALNAVIPSKDTAYKMLAAYGVTEVAKTDEAKRIGSKSLEVLEKAMDSYLKESEVE